MSLTFPGPLATLSCLLSVVHLLQFNDYAPSLTKLLLTSATDDPAIYAQTLRFQSTFVNSTLLKDYADSTVVLSGSIPCSALDSFE